MEKNENGNIVKWRTVPGRIYAEMVAEALRNKGIYCVIKGEDAGILGGSASGVSSPGKVAIWIDENNLDRAEEIAIDIIDHI